MLSALHKEGNTGFAGDLPEGVSVLSALHNEGNTGFAGDLLSMNLHHMTDPPGIICLTSAAVKAGFLIVAGKTIDPAVAGSAMCCGEIGIRTLGPVTRTTVFETAPIDHSGISP